ncbi:uncharacterized protein LOC115256058 [Aedes albopictus]|uniref:Reverse transcriptase domain-containing protein n=1 Tax=Aedes albopictus TaxID=7160 RepID=A0ABM1ZJR9_AEDAL
MGPKFALPMQRVQANTVYHLIADIESILRTNPDKTTQDRNRCLIGTQVQNFLSRPSLQQQNTPLSRFCTSAAKATKKFLTEHPDLCIIESDKGKKMVVMRLPDYEAKMLELLNEPNIYRILAKDPTSGIQLSTNNMVKRLTDLRLIDKQTRSTLQTQTSTCPRIYGQPKAHKPNLPLRPVVPTITAPTYQLSKYIASILQRTFTSQYNIVDSFSFAKFINETTIPDDHILVSFDVVSLFTKIPKELIMRSIIFRWDDIKQGTNINLDLFLEIIELCVDSSYFRFRDTYYLQTFGTAMGSPLSPILADYVMEDLLNDVTGKLQNNIPILKKYVDDLFLVLPATLVQHILNAINQYNPHLQFTVEVEKDRSLPFLDTLVIRNADQSLRTSWYSKPIASGRLLNYLSFHPTSMKINVATNFIRRVTSLTTSTSIDQQKQIIFQVLRQNNYPSSLINRLLTRSTTNIATPPTMPTAQAHTIPPPPPSTQPPTPPPPPPPPPTPPLPSQPPVPASASSMSSPMQDPSQPTSTSRVQPNASNHESHHQSSETIYRSVPNIPILSRTLAEILKKRLPISENRRKNRNMHQTSPQKCKRSHPTA